MIRLHATEHAEQSALIVWWAVYCQTKVIDERLLFSIPNGASKSIAQALKFKREGLRPGVPDLFLAVPHAPYSGLFLEMKGKGGMPSAAQKAWIRMLNGKGYRAVVCVGWDVARQVIEDYLSARAGAAKMTKIFSD